MGDGERGSRRVPIPAIVLGGAGLLPPLIAIFVRASAGAQPDAFAAFAMVFAFTYVALILSFLGGIWWGVAAAKLPPDRIGGLLALAVLPSLAAAAVQGLSGWSPHVAGLLLAAAVAATLLVDRGLAARQLVPRWWMRLRVPLSLGLAVEAGVLTALL